MGFRESGGKGIGAGMKVRNGEERHTAGILNYKKGMAKGTRRLGDEVCEKSPLVSRETEGKSPEARLLELMPALDEIDGESAECGIAMNESRLRMGGGMSPEEEHQLAEQKIAFLFHCIEHKSMVIFNFYLEIIPLRYYKHLSETHRKAFGELLLLALCNTAKKCKTQEFNNWEKWGPDHPDDFDNILQFDGSWHPIKYPISSGRRWRHVFEKVKEMQLESASMDFELIKPERWEAALLEARRDVYRTLLENEMKSMREGVRWKPEIVFEMYGMSNPFFARLDLLAERIGLGVGNEIEGFKDEIRRGAAGWKINTVLEKPTAQGVFEAHLALEYVDEAERERYERRLLGVESELAPSLRREVDAKLNKKIQEYKLNGTIHGLKDYMEKWQFWLERFPDLKEEAGWVVKEAEDKDAELRANYEATKDPSVLVELMDRMRKWEKQTPLFLAVHGMGGPFFAVLPAPMALECCKDCGSDIQMGGFDMFSADIKERVEVSYMERHSLNKGHELSAQLRGKIAQIERILGL